MAGIGGGDAQRGFALVTVLWAAMVLAVIVEAVLLTGHFEAKLARDRTRLAQLDTVAEAALDIAVLRLLDPSPAAQPPVGSIPFVINFDGHAVRVTVQDEAGKIDLNMAQGEVLRRLLTSVGVDVEIAQALVDKILDWREPGNFKRLNGAKAADYRRAGFSYGPRGGPFESVAELQLVMGMTPQLYSLIAPSLTVYSQTPWVDPELAPQPVLLALLGNAAAGQANQSVPSVGVRLGHAFMITADIVEAGTTHIAKTAVIRLTGARNPPFWVYRWD
jgi:general secretion pathway protein K